MEREGGTTWHVNCQNRMGANSHLPLWQARPLNDIRWKTSSFRLDVSQHRCSHDVYELSSKEKDQKHEMQKPAESFWVDGENQTQPNRNTQNISPQATKSSLNTLEDSAPCLSQEEGGMAAGKTT